MIFLRLFTILCKMEQDRVYGLLHRSDEARFQYSERTAIGLRSLTRQLPGRVPIYVIEAIGVKGWERSWNESQRFEPLSRRAIIPDTWINFVECLATEDKDFLSRAMRSSKEMAENFLQQQFIRNDFTGSPPPLDIEVAHFRSLYVQIEKNPTDFFIAKPDVAYIALAFKPAE